MSVATGFLKLSDGVWECALPRPKIDSWEWIKPNVRMADGSAFNWIDYPWTEGICRAWDNPLVREIWLQFAARVGKTVIAQSLLVAAIFNNPAAFLFGTSTETLAKQIVVKKLWPMFSHCPMTEPWCPPEHRQSQFRIDLRHATGYVAWSGSPTRLADISARYLHANEVSKWTRDKSDEADPLALFLERGAEVPDRKVIGESTPTIEGNCRISARVAGGTDRRLHVPCPHCGTFQELVLGDGAAGSGGLIWDKEADGHSNPNTAGRTARYQCRACSKEIHDESRRPMIARGVWVPRGCRAAKSGEIEGKYGGPIESFQLSRLYAPTFTFGDVAAAFVSAVHAGKAGDGEPLRNFFNSWMGQAWAEKRQRKASEDVAAALSVGSWSLGTCPEGVIFLTAGIDVQLDHFVYWVSGWGLDKRGWLVDFGTFESEAELRELLDREFPHASGGLPLTIKISLMDSRHRQEDVDNFCRSLSQQGRLVWPSQGISSKAMQGKPFRLGDADSARSKDRAKRIASNKTLQIVSINTEYWQGYVDRCLFTTPPANPGGFCFPRECESDGDLWNQLLNEVLDQAEGRWVQIKEHTPVDFRDTWRYARCAAEAGLRQNWTRLRPRRVDSRPAGSRPKPGVISQKGSVQFMPAPKL